MSMARVSQNIKDKSEACYYMVQQKSRNKRKKPLNLKPHYKA